MWCSFLWGKGGGVELCHIGSKSSHVVQGCPCVVSESCLITYFIICIAVGLLEYAIKIGLLFYLYCLFTGVLITDRFYTDSLITDRLFTDRLFTAEST